MASISRTSVVVLAVILALAHAIVATTSAQAAAPAGLPSHAAIIRAAKVAADYYRPTVANTTLTPRNGWSWGTSMQGVHALYGRAGDARYQADAMAWGRDNSWGLTTAETNPDTIKAGEVYYGLNRIDGSASLAAMDSRMSADLATLPLARYDWIDALFMGLPNWALWARRTGNTAYLTKMDALYAWTRDRGGTSARCAGRTPAQPGLFHAPSGLWFRDCTFVGARDASGQFVFWSRGNGWVIAALADVLQQLPAGDPRAAKYASMLRTMAAALRPLQGADGLWRSSLLNPALHPAPETSGTGLITYALAAGIRSGHLDAATYLPVVARAWRGLSTVALQPSGFLRYCQPPDIGPAAPYGAATPRTPPSGSTPGTLHHDSPPFCLGSFLLAAVEVATLVTSVSAGRPVSATAQQIGNEVRRINDGVVTTRWSAPGFPQVATIDLGSPQLVGNTQVIPYRDRAYRFRVEGSLDGASWRVMVDAANRSRSGSQLDEFTPVTVRYVRLTVLGVVGDPTTWVSIQEFAVYPPPS